MTIVHTIPVSHAGQYLCEISSGRNQSKQRAITTRASEVARLARNGAVIWVARAGGWVRMD
jgi:hypothetical protein